MCVSTNGGRGRGRESRADSLISVKSLRSGLLGDNLTDSGLSQLGRALRELQVSKVRPGGAWESNSWSLP